MPLDALALALGAAALHALWNLLLARERDTEGASAVALLVLVVVLVLPAALTWRVEGAAIPFIVASAALELAYIALLASAYRRYELSLVYPVARGLAPVLALVLVVAAGGARPSTLGILGVLAVALGVLLVRGAKGDLGGFAFGIVIAAAIAGYTVVDRYGIRHAAAGPYLLLVMLGPALVYSLDDRDRRGLGLRLLTGAARAAARECAGRGRRPRDERRDRDGRCRGRAARARRPGAACGRLRGRRGCGAAGALLEPPQELEQLGR
jgi:drug/metabolite transporter (DMT)-like permease